MLRGWGAYFRVGNSARKFHAGGSATCTSGWALFLQQEDGAKRAALEGTTHRAFFEQLGVYRLSGTVRWYTATPTAVR